MVSRITVLMIQGNTGVFIETSERLEYWITKEDRLHALMLSAPLDKKKEFEQAIEEIKQMDALR